LCSPVSVDFFGFNSNNEWQLSEQSFRAEPSLYQLDDGCFLPKQWSTLSIFTREELFNFLDLDGNDLTMIYNKYFDFLLNISVFQKWQTKMKDATNSLLTLKWLSSFLIG
jgi:hypothetical protein